jgi:hypothetical protein
MRRRGREIKAGTAAVLRMAATQKSEHASGSKADKSARNEGFLRGCLRILCPATSLAT